MFIKNNAELNDSSHNVVIQNSTISGGVTVTNGLTIEKCKELINTLLEDNKDYNPLVFYILTTNMEQISKIDGFKEDWTQEITNHYGEELGDWSPFDSENNILNILKEYHEKKGLDMNIFLFDFSSISFDEMDTILRSKLIRRKTRAVLIVDSFSLFTESYYKLAKKFDEITIGGCLILEPNYSNTLKTFLYEKNITVFTELNTFINQYSEHLDDITITPPETGGVQIDLQVTNKDSFFRKITQISQLYFPSVKEKREKDLSYKNTLEIVAGLGRKSNK